MADKTNSRKTNSRNSNCNTNGSSNNSNQSGLGLASISYADFVILSSTLSYAIAEELNDADLDMLIAFFGMIVSDLAILRTSRGINNAQQISTQEEETESESIIGSEDTSTSSSTLASVGNVRSNSKKKKRIKKIKRKKKKEK
ncbi:hypothetical protein [Romboutsia sp. Marseille-P6047]|uniref:hypothetical protein n=1 Tax=Romboutsia sp. Marseille-P6047 TaxID=2161817 RepID=UPI000F0664DC|nr:hypothetical protein [Romboutsia sp. Marseille-P6047]